MKTVISGNKVVTPIQTRFSDFDPMQHLNNAAYMSYIEIAKIDTFIRVLGINIKETTAAVARLNINYIKPVLMGSEIAVSTEITEVGRKSMTVSFKIIDAHNHEKVYATSEMDQVTLCMKTFKPVNHPDSLLNNIQLLSTGQMSTVKDMKSEEKIQAAS